MVSARRLRRHFFGAYYREDVCERFGATHSTWVRPLYWRMHRGIAARRVIFIHVPRVAGTSVALSLYGGVPVDHHSIRAWEALEPDFTRLTPSFALLRDPYAYFASSWRFVRNGGASEMALSDVFRKMTAHIDGVDAYLDFLEGKPPLDLDFVMRPQSWFVTDLTTGKPLVDHLFRLDRDAEAIADFIARHGGDPLPHRNRSIGEPLALTPAQRRRVESLFAADFTLMDLIAT
jgi:hypothetical protein